VAAPDPFDLDDEPLRLRVYSTGLGPHAYRLQIEGPYPQPRTFEELHEFMRTRLIGGGMPSGLFERDHPVIIQPARSTRWQHVLDTFDAAARARYTNITLGAPTT